MLDKLHFKSASRPEPVQPLYGRTLGSLRRPACVYTCPVLLSSSTCTDFKGALLPPRALQTQRLRRPQTVYSLTGARAHAQCSLAHIISLQSQACYSHHGRARPRASVCPQSHTCLAAPPASLSLSPTTWHFCFAYARPSSGNQWSSSASADVTAPRRLVHEAHRGETTQHLPGMRSASGFPVEESALYMGDHEHSIFFWKNSEGGAWLLQPPHALQRPWCPQCLQDLSFSRKGRRKSATWAASGNPRSSAGNRSTPASACGACAWRRIPH